MQNKALFLNHTDMCFLQIITNTALSERILIPVISSAWFNAMVPDFNAKHDMYCAWAGELQQLWGTVGKSQNLKVQRNLKSDFLQTLRIVLSVATKSEWRREQERSSPEDKNWETVINPSERLYSGGSKITADGDCNHDIKRHLLLGRKAMNNLDSILKSRNITLPTKVHLVKAMVFPVVMYGCESWTIKKAEHQRIGAFELWCWRRLLRVPWIARWSNQSIIKEISPEYSLEGLMLKLKLQYFGHLMQLELIPWIRPWCWERLKTGGERDDRGWDDWIASLTRWTEAWASFRNWWWSGKSGVLQSMGSQRVGHGWAAELNWRAHACLLSHWIIWLLATPWSVAHQAPLSLEFSRKEYRSGLLLPSPGNLPDPGVETLSPAWQEDSTTERPGKSDPEHTSF